MFIVRRSFRGPQGPHKAGSIVEPAEMKNFRYRLQQKHIVEVTEQNFERYQAFFKTRFNIEIPSLKQAKMAEEVAEAVAEIAAVVKEIEAVEPVEETVPVEETEEAEPVKKPEKAAPVKVVGNAK